MANDDRTTRFRPWPVALGAGVLPPSRPRALVWLLRSLAQVGTIPERLLEAILLFVPPRRVRSRTTALWVRRQTLRALPSDRRNDRAAGCAGCLRCAPTPALAAIVLGLWLFVLLVVMPITSAGLFGIDIVGGTRAAVLAHFAAAFLFVAVLAVAGLAIDVWRNPTVLPAVWRREVVALLGAALGSVLRSYLVVLSGPRQTLTSVHVLDPQEPVRSGQRASSPPIRTQR